MPLIFVVDDSPVERGYASLLISKAFKDVRVVQCGNGIEALARFEHSAADLILTDLQMPDINGLELLEQLRSQGSQVPVVLMTGKGSEEIAVKALLAGATSYIPKSALDKYLIDTIGNVLRLSRRRCSSRRVMHHLVRHEQTYCFGNEVSLMTPFIEIIQELIAGATQFEESEITRLGMALHEALTNAIYHGNLELDSELRQEDERQFYELGEDRRVRLPYRERQVHVGVRFTATEARFIIRDDGPGFDAAKCMAKLDEISLDRIGGRGLMLIRSFMDDVSFNDAGNEIQMTKRHSRPELNITVEGAALAIA